MSQGAGDGDFLGAGGADSAVQRQSRSAGQGVHHEASHQPPEDQQDHGDPEEQQ